VEKISQLPVASLQTINNYLKSPVIKTTISEAASETANRIEDLISTATKPFENPAFQADAKVALEKASIGADTLLKAMDKPIDAAIDKLNDAGEKALSGIASGTVKAASDAVAAVPGVGTLVELPKIADDISKAAGTVIEAGSDAIETASEFYETTKGNFEAEQKKLENLSKQAFDTEKRINSSINDFTRVPNIPSLPQVGSLPTVGSLPQVEASLPEVEASLPQGPTPIRGGKTKSILKKNDAKTRKGHSNRKSSTKRVSFFI
jgi:hypothetical protein